MPVFPGVTLTGRTEGESEENGTFLLRHELTQPEGKPVLRLTERVSQLAWSDNV